MEHPASRRPGARLGQCLARWIALGLVLTGTGCSGSPFGEQLSRSFSQPPAAPGAAAGPPTASPPAPSTATATPTPTPTARATAAEPSQPKTSPGTAARPPAAAPLPKAPVQPLAPAPYRLTLQLPAVDPAAPAEAVTQALRAAGLAFEVERIERISPGTASGAAPASAPASAPAPAPR